MATAATAATAARPAPLRIELEKQPLEDCAQSKENWSEQTIANIHDYSKDLFRDAKLNFTTHKPPPPNSHVLLLYTELYEEQPMSPRVYKFSVPVCDIDGDLYACLHLSHNRFIDAAESVWERRAIVLCPDQRLTDTDIGHSMSSYSLFRQIAVHFSTWIQKCYLIHRRNCEHAAHFELAERGQAYSLKPSDEPPITISYLWCFTTRIRPQGRLKAAEEARKRRRLQDELPSDDE